MSKECPKQEGRRNEKFKEDYPKWIFEQLRLEEEVKAKKDKNIQKPVPGNANPDFDPKEGIVKI